MNIFRLNLVFLNFLRKFFLENLDLKKREMKHLLHDFWLILQISQNENNNHFFKIYFCQR